jgi:hypothetical protein
VSLGWRWGDAGVTLGWCWVLLSTSAVTEGGQLTGVVLGGIGVVVVAGRDIPGLYMGIWHHLESSRVATQLGNPKRVKVHMLWRGGGGLGACPEDMPGIGEPEEKELFAGPSATLGYDDEPGGCATTVQI